jgi:pimeloyl-ACP methyl ester carboxylesterase
MGSRLLERRGYRVAAYDARGHGESDPAGEPAGYEYADLTTDLGAVLDAVAPGGAVLVGSSMGAATAISFALAHPERVHALVQITPAFAGRPYDGAEELARWDALAEGLELGGVDGFMAVFERGVGGRWRESELTHTRQRLERQRHPQAVADALRVVPRSAAFDGLAALEAIDVPVLVVGSRDEADAEHPLAVAKQYAERLPRAELVVEGEGESPLAWRGAALSREIDAFLGRAGLGPQE